MAIETLILGTGNSGTRLLVQLLRRHLPPFQESAPFAYEPLYWEGSYFDGKLLPSADGLAEHIRFPLFPGPEVDRWPWMEAFLRERSGWAKFIRASSRIRLFAAVAPKIVWITRGLYSYLGSMQRNFPRCGDGSGWHHRPGRYDDFHRLRELYPDFLGEPIDRERVVAEAAWWHVQNRELPRFIGKPNVHFLRYEDLCQEPESSLDSLFRFLGAAPDDATLAAAASAVGEARVWEPTLEVDQERRISRMAGGLNLLLFGNG